MSAKPALTRRLVNIELSAAGMSTCNDRSARPAPRTRDHGHHLSTVDLADRIVHELVALTGSEDGEVAPEDARILRDSDAKTGAGRLLDAGREISLEVGGEFRSLRQIRALPGVEHAAGIRMRKAVPSSGAVLRVVDPDTFVISPSWLQKTQDSLVKTVRYSPGLSSIWEGPS